jgi:hypothetical protein
MKRDEKKEARRRLELRKETLRQVDQAALQQVAGGYYFWLPCMGTTGSYFC